MYLIDKFEIINFLFNKVFFDCWEKCQYTVVHPCSLIIILEMKRNRTEIMLWGPKRALKGRGALSPNLRGTSVTIKLRISSLTTQREWDNLWKVSARIRASSSRRVPISRHSNTSSKQTEAIRWTCKDEESKRKHKNAAISCDYQILNYPKDISPIFVCLKLKGISLEFWKIMENAMWR